MNARDVSRRTPLHYACESEHKDAVKLVQILLRFGARTNVQDESGKTPLHEACTKMNYRMVVKLLRHGARILVDDYGWTPLHCTCHEAMNSDTTQIVRALLSERTKHNSFEGKHWAGHMYVEELIYAVNLQTRDYDNTALHLALQQRPYTMKSDNEVIYSLLRMDAEVEFKRIVKKMAALSGDCEDNAILVVCLLLGAGAKVGVQNYFGMTALHFAGKCCAAEVVEILMECGEYVNAKDINGNTPLHLTCSPDSNHSYPPFPSRAMKCRVRTIEALLSRGATLQAKNTDRKTPYDGLADIYREKYWRSGSSQKEKKHIELTFIKHVIKRRSLNLREEFNSEWRMGVDFFDEIRLECCQELEVMKSVVIVKDVSMYGVLSHINQPYHLSCNDLLKIRKAIRSEDLSTKFPYYHESLVITYKRSELLTMAVQSFYKEHRKMKFFPNVVAEQLLSFLSNEDLKSFLHSEEK